jgi:hypothetical protein
MRISGLTDEATPRILYSGNEAPEGSEMKAKDLDLSGGVAARLRVFIGQLDAPGHTIYPAREFEEAAIPDVFWRSSVRTYKSDRSDPKHMISVGGQPVVTFAGIYGLDWLQWLAGQLDVQHNGGDFSGRGTEARAIAAALVAYLSAVETA